LNVTTATVLLSACVKANRAFFNIRQLGDEACLMLKKFNLLFSFFIREFTYQNAHRNLNLDDLAQILL
jgi:hypothetical protein